MAQSSSKLLDLTGLTFPKDTCIVIIRTEWNAPIVDLLEEGTIKILNQNKIAFILITVPGAFELGFAIKSYWENHQYKSSKIHAFIALGCVLRGDTPHFEYVCNAVSVAITQLNLILPVPTIFGILTVNTQTEADERTGGKYGNKGEEAAITALKMIALNQSFKK